MIRQRRLTVLLLILGAIAALELWAHLAEPTPAAGLPVDRMQRPPARQAPAQDTRLVDHAVANRPANPTTSAAPLVPDAVPLAQAMLLFGPATRLQPRLSAPLPPPAPAPMQESMVPEAPPPPPVRARGLYSEPGQAPQVLLEDSRGELALLRVGAALDGVGAGWLVEALDAESVVLRHRDGERRQRLNLPTTP